MATILKLQIKLQIAALNNVLYSSSLYFGIGFDVCPVWYRSDTEITEPILRNGPQVAD
jgi:hypothetical protein